MPEINNFEQWKDFLAERLNQAKKEGFSENVISELAYDIGGYLKDEVTPDIPENKVLLQLWNVANTEERHSLANTMIKLVQK